MRAYAGQIYRSLKTACELAYEQIGGVSMAYRMTRLKGTSTLTKYASRSEDDEESFMPIDIAIDLDRAAKSPIITGTMAAALGYRLVPDDGHERRAVTREDGTIITLEVMDVVRALHEAFSDNKIDAADRKALLKETTEAIVVLEQLRDNLSGDA